MKFNKLMTAMALAGMACSGAALATDGMFSSGYGMTANGMGGAATAMTEDTFGGANNPASMVFVGNRLDLGASLFSPHRSATMYANDPYAAYGYPNNVSESSDANYFVVPEIGYNHMMSDKLSLGVSVYGNGGMNTDYAPNNAFGPGTNMMGGSGNLGVNLVQLIVAPTLAIKINDNNAVGILPLLGYQMFSAQGLQGFESSSSAPTLMTNNGTDTATGAGVRVGYLGKITPDLSFGAAYATKITMSKFSKYAGLFANQGELDMTANYSVGVAYKVIPALTVALDYQDILYSGVNAIGDAPTAGPFGASGGGGFGWSDISVWKLGAEYKYNDSWALRAGWNHCDSPISSADVTINVIAPGVITDHLTLGASYYTQSGGEWTFAYTHAFSNSVSGADMNGLGTDTIRMYQDTAGIAYAWKM